MSLCSLSAVLTLVLVSEAEEASGPLYGWHACDDLWRVGHYRRGKFGKRLEHNLISLIFKTKPKLFVLKRFLSLGWCYRASWQKEGTQNCGAQVWHCACYCPCLFTAITNAYDAV